MPHAILLVDLVTQVLHTRFYCHPSLQSNIKRARRRENSHFCLEDYHAHTVVSTEMASLGAMQLASRQDMTWLRVFDSNLPREHSALQFCLVLDSILTMQCTDSVSITKTFSIQTK